MRHLNCMSNKYNIDERMMQSIGATFNFLRPFKRFYVVCSIVIVISIFIIRNDGKQLKVEPTKIPIRSNVTHSNKTKIIYTNSVPEWFYVKKETVFNDLNCPVKNCRITTNQSEKESADLVWFFEVYENKKYVRNPKQIFAWYSIECPAMRPYKFDPPDIINWTISYRYDSTIPAPIRKWTYYDPHIKQKEQTINYAQNKTKKVAWFVTNCNSHNDRMKYAKELQKYIQVDIYGKCGNLSCGVNAENSEMIPKQNNKCMDLLNKDYKFYLSFENSNCYEYITEKFFVNALQRNVLPIVMGARREDYKKYAPYRSYIHVEDFDSPAHLAKYLHLLDENDDLYNSYFKWKGTGELSDNYFDFWCQMCAMLHDEKVMSTTQSVDMEKWWASACIHGFWRNLYNSTEV